MRSKILILILVIAVQCCTENNRQVFTYNDVVDTLIRVSEGTVSPNDVHVIVLGSSEIYYTNNVEGMEFLSEVIDKVIIEYPSLFIREYSKLNKKEKIALDIIISGMSEDSNIQEARSQIEKVKTIHIFSKRKIKKILASEQY